MGKVESSICAIRMSLLPSGGNHMSAKSSVFPPKEILENTIIIKKN